MELSEKCSITVDDIQEHLLNNENLGTSALEGESGDDIVTDYKYVGRDFRN